MPALAADPALQAFIRLICFHLMSPTLAGEIVGLPMDVRTAIEELTAASILGLRP